MSKVGPIIELHPWLALPSGQALLDWEQAQVDRLVADVFGFHALQLGLPELDGLRCNRMPHKWLALDSRYAAWQPPADRAPLIHEPLVLPEGLMHGAPLGLRCEFEALPVASNSLDLVVLPHALEMAHDPHATLREVERVLVPEGRVVISGLNPLSLWGLRQARAHLCARLGLTGLGASRLYLPEAGEFIGHWRLRDWLRLLSFEVDSCQFGAYRPAVRTDKWLQRWGWIEGVGTRWWPILGAAYFLVAVKRVHGMRLLEPAWRNQRQRSAATVPVANRAGGRVPAAHASPLRRDQT